MKLTLLFAIILSFLCQNTFAKETSNQYGTFSEQIKSAKKLMPKFLKESETFKQKFTEVVTSANQKGVRITKDEAIALFVVLRDEMQDFQENYIEQQQACVDELREVKKKSGKKNKCEEEVKRYSVLDILDEEVQSKIFQEIIERSAEIINRDMIIDNNEFSELSRMGFGGDYFNILDSFARYTITHH